MNPEKMPKKEGRELRDQFEHDAMSIFSIVQSAVFLLKEFEQSDEKRSETGFMLQKNWKRLFSTAEQFLNGEFGSMDDELRAEIEKLLEFKDKNFADPGVLEGVVKFFEEIKKRQRKEDGQE